MSLNNITLPPQLLADFYGTSLVEGAAMPVPVRPPVAFLGENAKRILVAVNKSGVAFLPEGELAFLTSILSACGLALSDVAIVNTQHEKGFDADDAVAQLQPKRVLLFDVETAAFRFAQAEPYAVQLAGEMVYVTAPPLNRIENSKEEKRRLWTALKTAFGL